MRSRGGRNVGVGDEASLAVAQDAGDGEGDVVGLKLGGAAEDEVLAAEGDGILIFRDGLVAQDALEGPVAGAETALEVGVEALAAAAGDGEVQHDLAVGGGEEIFETELGRGRIAVRDFEDEAVGEDSGGITHDREAVAHGVVVECKTEQAPGIVAQASTKKPERILKVSTLHLEVLRAEMHALRPDDARQKFHKHNLCRRYTNYRRLRTPRGGWNRRCWTRLAR